MAELGDKTQLAVITLTADTRRPLSVFLGSTLALAIVTGIGVLFGCAILQIVPAYIVRRVAAVAFIVIGLFMFFGKL